MSMTVCSAAYATTVSKSVKVRNKNTYNDSLTTAAATYTATGTSSKAKTSMISKSYSKLYCNIFTAKNDYNTGSYSYSSNIAVVASHGDTFERSVTRNPSSAVVDYIHCVESYYSSSKLSSTLADKYSYTAMQSIDNNIDSKV